MRTDGSGAPGSGAPGSGALGFGVLGDRTRRSILELLAERPRSVGELAADLPVSRPAVSQHLRALKDAGLVRDRPAGTRRVYRLDPAGIAGLRAYLDRLLPQAPTGHAEPSDAEPGDAEPSDAEAGGPEPGSQPSPQPSPQPGSQPA